MRNESGKVKPLPWGEQIIADAPGRVVCADYVYMQATSKSGETYLLVLKDSFSHICRLVPTKTPDSLTFVRALLQWVAQYGVPEVLITDGGSHFRCSITAHLRKALGYKHHITLAYTPWSNSQIERHNRELLKMFRCMCSERKWDTSRWTDLTTMVEYTLNVTEVPTLKVSPIEIHTGIVPINAMRFMTVHGARLKSVDKAVPEIALVKKHLKKLRRVFKEMHDFVRRKKQLNRAATGRRREKPRSPMAQIAPSNTSTGKSAAFVG